MGDVLSPILVASILREQGRSISEMQGDGSRLLAIGSILHFARTGDTLWGCGAALGKVADEQHVFDSLDVRATRGPLTRDYLLSRGIDAPEVYGDPALLLPRFLPRSGFKKRRRTP